MVSPSTSLAATRRSDDGAASAPATGTSMVAVAACADGLSGVDFQQFLIALFLLGLGWNFMFTGSTALALTTYYQTTRTPPITKQLYRKSGVI